jgi:hypothetical protein
VNALPNASVGDKFGQPRRPRPTSGKAVIDIERLNRSFLRGDVLVP